jgi:hypothetical protein
MLNAVFWDIKTPFTPHRKHVTSPLHSPAGLRFEVFPAVAMKNAVFWDIKLSSYLTGDTSHLRYWAQPVNAM